MAHQSRGPGPNVPAVTAAYPEQTMHPLNRLYCVFIGCFHPGSGRSPGGGNGNPLQYSCLGNSMDRGAWRATVHGVARVGHDLVTKPLPLDA